MSAAEQHTLLIVLCLAVLAPVLADQVPRVRLPVVVLEILLGILVGPQVLAWAQPVRHKLEAIGFGFFVPIFFVVTGESEPRAAPDWTKVQ